MGLGPRACPGSNRQLGSDDRFDPGHFRGAIELRRAMDAVAIEQRQRGIAQLGGSFDQRSGKRGAIEK